MPDFFHPQNNIFLYSFCMVFVDLGWSCGTVVIWFAQIWCGASMKVVVQSPFGFLDYTKYDQQESTNEVVTKSTRKEHTFHFLFPSTNITLLGYTLSTTGWRSSQGASSKLVLNLDAQLHLQMCALIQIPNQYIVCIYIYIYTYIYRTHFPFSKQMQVSV